MLLARHGGSVNRTIEPMARHGGTVNKDRTIEPRARHSGTVNRTIEPQQRALKEFDGFDDETVENTGSPLALAAQDTAEASMDLNRTEDPRLMKKIEHERASAAQPEGRIF